MPGLCIDNLVYARQREAILTTRVVKIRIVYAYFPLALFLQNYHSVSKPFRVFGFSDKPSHQKVIYFGLDDLMVVRVEEPYSLPNGSGGWENIRLVGSVHGAYPYHVRMSPGEHVGVSLLYFLQPGPFFFNQEGTNIGAPVRAAYKHGFQGIYRQFFPVF